MPRLAALLLLLLPTLAAAQTRMASGIPGPSYWQNRADYRIAASIDPATRTLRGSEIITYTNNSPTPLDVLWLQLDQNIYRPDARANALPDRDPRKPDQYTTGLVLDRISAGQGATTTTPAHTVTDTRLQLRLATPLPAHAAITLRIEWHYTIPGEWAGRTAVSTSPDGDIFEIAQWYPRMAVYDDLHGWDTAPYLGSEFHLEYGRIDYAVTVPANYLVAGSGALLNPADVLTKTQRTRLAEAANSDQTVIIRTAQDITDAKPSPKPTQGTRTWHFAMNDTRDAAFVATPAFMWDAARITLPNGTHALAQSIYPRTSAAAWARSTEYVKFTIEHFSARYFPYPWPSMINVAGHGAAMEYPGIVFDAKTDAGKDLFWITVHEVGHSWFPMIVGSDERHDAWMDEGFNTFIDVEASDAFHPNASGQGEFGPKRDVEYAPGGGNPAAEMVPILADTAAAPIETPADRIGEPHRHAISYFKPAFGLHLLRDLILGPDRFDPAFRHYIAAWAYKHPAPNDFFNLMQSDGGESLTDFRHAWFATTTKLDITLDGFHPVADGTVIDLTAHTPLILPIPLAITTADGTHHRVTVPMEAFGQGPTAHAALIAPAKVTAVALDPDHLLPQ